MSSQRMTLACSCETFIFTWLAVGPQHWRLVLMSEDLIVLPLMFPLKSMEALDCPDILPLHWIAGVLLLDGGVLSFVDTYCSATVGFGLWGGESWHSGISLMCKAIGCFCGNELSVDAATFILNSMIFPAYSYYRVSIIIESQCPLSWKFMLLFLHSAILSSVRYGLTMREHIRHWDEQKMTLSMRKAFCWKCK